MLIIVRVSRRLIKERECLPRLTSDTYLTGAQFPVNSAVSKVARILQILKIHRKSRARRMMIIFSLL